MPGGLIVNDTGCLSTREKLIGLGLSLASPLLLILALMWRWSRADLKQHRRFAAVLPQARR
jgi:hypothetical protein